MKICRSREGAWIEIVARPVSNIGTFVAPVRERGLKSHCYAIPTQKQIVAPVRERGLKLAFKICSQLSLAVAPVRERGLKYKTSPVLSGLRIVAPVRERGLKYSLYTSSVKVLYGRSREGAWIEIRNTVGFSVLLTQMTYSD